MYQIDQVVVGEHKIVVGTELAYKQKVVDEILANAKMRVGTVTVIGISSARGGHKVVYYVSEAGDVEGETRSDHLLDTFDVVSNPKRSEANAAIIQMWLKFGGEFHGPRVETATMSMHKLFVMMRAISSALMGGAENPLTPAQVKPFQSKLYRIVPATDGTQVLFFIREGYGGDPYIVTHEVEGDNTLHATQFMHQYGEQGDAIKHLASLKTADADRVVAAIKAKG